MKALRILKPLAVLALLASVSIYLLNASWLAPAPSGKPFLVSHRGVYQMYDHENVGRDDCTATRIFPPTHEFIENTLPSMAEAFDAGADAVELDVHPTTDGEFAVFHDWTLDCRTDGQGVTRRQEMSYLRTLDLGYGYTADGGETWPLRGKGVGMMPTLSEVYRAFPGKSFIINIKSNDPSEADRLAAYLQRHGLLEQGGLPLVYGGADAMERLRTLFPDALIPSRASVKACTRDYILWGWAGRVPRVCTNSVIMVPMDQSHLFWGWPNRFLARMRDKNVSVLVLGSRSASNGINGVERVEQLESLPPGFDGFVWIEAIESVGPWLRKR